MTLSKSRLFKAGLLIAVLLTGFYLCFHHSPDSPTLPLKIVEVITTREGPIQETVSLLGTINSKHSAVLYAKANGRLDILVSPGQEVKKNTLLAQIDNSDYEKAVKFSEDSEAIAKGQYQRLIDLQKKGFVSSREVDEKKQAWLNAQKNLSKARIDLDLLRFYAPFDGIVGAYKKKEGMQISTGESILTIYNPATLVVDFDIPCTTLKNIKNGQKVKIFHKVYPLTHFQKMIDEETHMCPADVDFSCTDCLIGSTVRLDLVVKEKFKSIVIPLSAVFFRNGNAYTYIVEKGKIALRAIDTGIKYKGLIEVEKGLQPNTAVVIKGLERLYPELPVEIYQDPKSL